MVYTLLLYCQHLIKFNIFLFFWGGVGGIFHIAMSTKRNIISNVSLSVPVSIAEQSKAWTVYDCFNIEIASLNPARGMDVCLRVSVLSCVLVEALC